MRVFLFRHGATAGNLERRYIGATDPPLCPEGRAALTARPDWENITEVWVSPLRRTAQTAAILFPHAVLHRCPELAEMNFGDFENQSWQQLSSNPDYQAWLDSFCALPCPNGESRDEFVKRSCRAFERLVDRALGKSDGVPLCIVAHGGTVMAVLSAYSRPQAGYFSFGTPCGGCWELEIDEKQWRKERVLKIVRRPQGE